MVVIRLARGGSKNRPCYRVVVADHRMPRDGRFIEKVGTYDPRRQQNGLELKLDRILHWQSVGAKPSETVGQLIKRYQAALVA